MFNRPQNGLSHTQAGGPLISRIESGGPPAATFTAVLSRPIILQNLASEDQQAALLSARLDEPTAGSSSYSTATPPTASSTPTRKTSPA